MNGLCDVGSSQKLLSDRAVVAVIDNYRLSSHLSAFDSPSFPYSFF